LLGDERVLRQGTEKGGLMSFKGIMKRIRGWLGNAVVWGAAWSVATLPVLGLLYLNGWGYLVPDVAGAIAKTFFAMGFVAGGSFSTYLGIAYRNKNFEELMPGKFALLGAIFGGLLVPAFEFVPGIALFLGLPFSGAMAAGVGLAATLGGATAFGTVKVAQQAALTSGTESVGELESGAGVLASPELD
jgi:hypothetical protein